MMDGTLTIRNQCYRLTHIAPSPWKVLMFSYYAKDQYLYLTTSLGFTLHRITYEYHQTFSFSVSRLGSRSNQKTLQVTSQFRFARQIIKNTDFSSSISTLHLLCQHVRIRADQFIFFLYNRHNISSSAETQSLKSRSYLTILCHVCMHAVKGELHHTKTQLPGRRNFP